MEILENKTNEIWLNTVFSIHRVLIVSLEIISVTAIMLIYERLKEQSYTWIM